MELVKRYWLWAAILAAIIIAAAYWPGMANAADLGGGCCADLEERIAELEATAARKGNKKVSVTVYGQINKAVVWWDAGDESDFAVSENSASESFLGIAGEAKFGSGWKAGYVLEIGVGGYDNEQYYFGYGPLGDGDTNDLYTRRAFVYVGGELGTLSLGHAAQATDSIVEITTANTAPAVRMLSLRPIIGPQVLEALDIFDGQRTDLIRYDSPTFSGFTVSASWAPGNDLVGGGDADSWDVALRYAGEFSGFRVAAGVGYRDVLVLPTIGNVDEINTLSGSASVMHVTSGIFVTGAYGDTDVDLIGADITGWQGQAGIEQKLLGNIGKTTLFGEYGEVDIFGATDVTLWGGGVVQAIDQAALDLYLNFRSYDVGAEDDILVGTAGGRIRF